MQVFTLLHVESCTQDGNGTVRLENGTFGKVLVCWGDEWRGLAKESIQTTQQANDICQMLMLENFTVSDEGNVAGVHGNIK